MLRDVHHLLSIDPVCLGVAEFGLKYGGGGHKGLGVVLPILLRTCLVVSVPQVALLPRGPMRAVLQLGLHASSFQNTSNAPPKCLPAPERCFISPLPSSSGPETTCIRFSSLLTEDAVTLVSHRDSEGQSEEGRRPFEVNPHTVKAFPYSSQTGRRRPAQAHTLVCGVF